MKVQRRKILHFTPPSEAMFVAGKWYRTKEAAEIAGVTPDTVSRRWRARGLRSQSLLKGYRYRGEWLNEFVEKNNAINS